MIPLLTAQAVSMDGFFNGPELLGATVAVTVADQDGKIVFDRNGSIHVAPASNEKLFTGAFALYELGPDYVPVTKIWKMTDRVVVDSPGDPSLTHDALKKAAEQMGLDGTLPVYVNQAYDPEIPEGWEIGDLSDRYAAPVAAFSVDQSGFELWDHGGRLELRPEAYGVAISRSDTKGKRSSFSYDPMTRRVTAKGAFADKTVRLDTLAVPGATAAAASLLGRGVFGADQDPSEPPTAQIFGKPLSQILADCLRPSDNNMAENLLLMGGSHEGPLDKGNPYPLSTRRLKEFLSNAAGIDPWDVWPRDGSGLTRANLVTTHAVVALLRWADSQPTSAVWKNALAAPGIGTLARRLPGLDFHGKTGSLAHVTALSGYLVTRGGKKLTLSVIVNGFTCSDAQVHTAIDHFVQFLSERTP